MVTILRKVRYRLIRLEKDIKDVKHTGFNEAEKKTAARRLRDLERQLYGRNSQASGL